MSMLKINQEKDGLIRKIAQKYDLRLLFLFGSQITGQTHKESDFDFGYLASPDLSIEEEGYLIGELMPIAEANDERAVNLVNFKRASPLLLHSALNNAQLLYEKEAGAFANFQNYGFKVYIETLPLFELKAERMGIAPK